MYNISPELQIRVELLKDMLMYRVDKCQCTGWLKKVSCCTVSTAYFFLSHPVYSLMMN